MSPGKPWNLVCESPGKSWKTVSECLYEPCYMFVLNILCMTYFVTSSLAVSEAAMRVKSTQLIKSFFKQKKRENMEIQEIFT